MDGQVQAESARVLCIGTGGLGSPLAMYLRGRSVGTLGLVDFDVVDASNLHRQIIHFNPGCRHAELGSAEEKVHGINPNVIVRKCETKLTSANALEISKTLTSSVDGTDNFPTRYLINDACVLSGKPNVYGRIFRFEAKPAYSQHPRDAPAASRAMLSLRSIRSHLRRAWFRHAPKAACWASCLG